ncbi:MAG: 6-phosphogluconolactonase [Bacteroidota bacterium]|jgi:6-phosphogluconolactonase
MKKEFNSKAQLEVQLASEIEASINQAIQQFGDARILLSGGSTPIGLYAKLAEAPIDWKKVNIGLVDERFVPIDHPSNNEKMIRTQLGDKTGAAILSMVPDSSNRLNNLSLVDENYAPFKERIDFCLLGMGEDGHTASLFPNDPNSEENLNNDFIGFVNTQAPVEPTNRISCSKELLLKSTHLAVMLIGENKLTVFNQAKEAKYPISYFTSKLVVYYTEK